MDPHLCKKNELPKIFPIKRIVDEAAGIKSIFLDGFLECKPGQFVMVWLPDVEEKPMAVSYHSENELAFTYHTMGKFTKACNNLKRGDKLGIRGPYGSSFSNAESCVVVGGGVGMASVSTLIDSLKNPMIINGARDKGHLLYKNRFKGQIIVTDDGSEGKKGFTTEVLKEILEENPDIKKVYTCGPEIMMKKVLELCNNAKIDCEASLERYMKCGFGICGNCMIGKKIVCTDGPIFNAKELNKMEEFGKYARLKTGKKVTLKEYYNWKT